MHMLTERQENLLFALIREHIRSAEPVGSSTIVEKHGFDVSPATIRIELGALEDQGYIAQPHTSAGRIPTEAGYRYFVERLLARMATSPDSPLAKGGPKGGLNIKLPKDAEQAVKAVAKQLAEGTGTAVFVGFRPRHVYYTGLSLLFAQPEFQELGRIARFSEIIDRLDDVVERVFPKVDTKVTVWLGRDNPFGGLCATVVTRYGSTSSPRAASGIIGLLGPLRMDYERNWQLITAAQHLLERV